VIRRVVDGGRSGSVGPGVALVRGARISIVLSVALLLSTGRIAAQTKSAPAWSVDSASITFEIRNAGFPVHGSFGGLQADIGFDPAHPEAGRIVASIDPETVETGIAMRDRHLVRHGWFDVRRFGRITMRSVRLLTAGDGGYRGRFVLGIRDVEREVEVPFTFSSSGTTARMAGTVTIDRLDFGIGERSIVLSNDVRIDVVLRLGRR
jgi:polyisoprenoid-binding protein YceI